jgi:hypothetical protein
MHARLITMHLKHGNAQELSVLYRDSILPALRQQKGFMETNFGIDKNGKAIAFVIFDSKQDALASEENGYLSEQIAKAMPYLDYPPIVEYFDVPVKS